MMPDKEQVKNLLVETVTLLCKNSLGYKDHLRVEGLLGVAIDDKDVFFLHISENFLNTPAVSQTSDPSTSTETVKDQNIGSDSNYQDHEEHFMQKSKNPVDSVKLKDEPTDSDDDLVMIPSPELRPPDMVAQRASRIAGQRRPPSSPRPKSPIRSASYANRNDISVYRNSFAETTELGHDMQYVIQSDSDEPPEKRLALERNETTFDVTRQERYLDSAAKDTENSSERDARYQQSGWTDVPPGGSTTIKVEMPEGNSQYESEEQGLTHSTPYVWTVAPTSEEGDQQTREDFQRYIAQSWNKNTVKKTNSVTKKFEAFVTKQGFQKKLVEFLPKELDALIGQWILNERKPDGEEYEPDTLTSNHRALDRYLKEEGFEKCASREILAAKRKHLKSLGLGNRKNKAEALTVDDEEKLWESGSLGRSNADILQRTVWFLLTKQLGFRGSSEARQLSYGDLEGKHDIDGSVYFEWTENASEIRQGVSSSARSFNPKLFQNTDDPSRCPVTLVKEFLTHRPMTM